MKKQLFSKNYYDPVDQVTQYKDFYTSALRLQGRAVRMKSSPFLHTPGIIQGIRPGIGQDPESFCDCNSTQPDKVNPENLLAALVSIQYLALVCLKFCQPKSEATLSTTTSPHTDLEIKRNLALLSDGIAEVPRTRSSLAISDDRKDRWISKTIAQLAKSKRPKQRRKGHRRIEESRIFTIRTDSDLFPNQFTHDGFQIGKKHVLHLRLIELSSRLSSRIIFRCLLKTISTIFELSFNKKLLK